MGKSLRFAVIPTYFSFQNLILFVGQSGAAVVLLICLFFIITTRALKDTRVCYLDILLLGFTI